MRKILLLVLCSMVLMFTGCISLHSNYGSNSVGPPGIKKVSLIADVEVNGKISGSSSANVLFWFIKWGSDNEYADGVTFTSGAEAEGFSFNPLAVLTKSKHVEDAKLAAAYKALVGTEVDYMLNPRYEVEVESYVVFKRIKAKVSGYGCKVKEFRQVEDDRIFEEDSDEE